MIRFQLISLSGVKFDKDVYEVIVPTASGQIGVLSHHMALISVAVPGAIAIRHDSRDPDSQLEYFAINGGAVEITDGLLKVLVDDADHADDINEADAKAAVERAQKMKAEAKDSVSLEHAQSLVDRHTVRLQVASLKRRKR
ncbi:MAG: synthase epsilon chain [Candidatus Saccharibacteria bacterium]|nr:synthase epsilon chain [Candidatus Saccharibacteria bacterium]